MKTLATISFLPSLKPSTVRQLHSCCASFSHTSCLEIYQRSSACGVGFDLKKKLCPPSCLLSDVYTRSLLGFFLGVLQSRVDAQLLQLLHQVSVLVHLEQDVAASHKLAIEVDLRDCGPVGEDLDSLPEVLVI